MIGANNDKRVQIITIMMSWGQIFNEKIGVVTKEKILVIYVLI